MAGIGGAGMTPLAIYLAQLGHSITGYDNNFRQPVRTLLESQGIRIIDKPILSANTSRVVYSNALSKNAPVIIEAKKNGLPLLKRGEMLAEVTSHKKLIAIVGSHGKTTTAGMIISAMQANNMPFDYILGGYFSNQNILLPAKKQKASEWLVTEVDESDGTIEHFCPEITVAINFDWDHVDLYPRCQDLENTFQKLFQRTRATLFIPDGCNILCRLSSASQATVKTFGTKGHYSGKVTQVTDEIFQLTLGISFEIDAIKVRARGAFNAHNALAALAVVQHQNGSLVSHSLSHFPGIYRRQQVLYKDHKSVIYQDYAHHPTEIEALLHFACDAYPQHQKIVVFQPHRYSRTSHYKKAFVQSLQKADKVFLMETYSASEALIKGGERSDLIACFDTSFDLEPVYTLPSLLAQLNRILQAKNLILFVGAGDIDLWATACVKKFIAEKKPISPINEALSQQPDSDNWWEILSSKTNTSTYLARAEKLADKTTLHVGGAARYYAEPDSLEDLCLLLKAAKKANQAIFILGRGSNLIIPDEEFEGLVIRLNKHYWKSIEKRENQRLWVSAGAPLRQVCSFAKQQGWSGFEFLDGIPGSLGGALRMNAGAMGNWIFDRVESVRILSLNGEIKEIKQRDLRIVYRECHELKEAIALGAILKATDQTDSSAVKTKLAQFADYRRTSQPKQLSAGCIFKNPPQETAGALIDKLGLKGRRCGTARISPIHGNFIINEGGATYKEIITLIQEIRAEVKSRKGIELEPEVLLLGKKWEDVL